MGQILNGDSEEATRHQSLFRRSAILKVMSSGLLFLAFTLFGSFYFGVVDHWPNTCVRTKHGECIEFAQGTELDFQQAMYMSVITLTTVGFGDLTPKDNVGRIVAMFWMVFGVTSTALFVRRVQEFLFAMDGQMDLSKMMISELDLTTFQEIDNVDGHQDGYVTRGEFLSYLMKKHQLVDADVIDDANRMFDRLTAAATERRRESETYDGTCERNVRMVDIEEVQHRLSAENLS